MNTKQEEQVMAGVEGATLGDILHLTTKTDTAIHRLPQPKALREVFEAIDKTDLSHQTGQYTQLLQTDALSAIDQLRHRADMMRRRADEFDEMADKFQSAVDKIIKDTGSVSDTHQAILNLLSEHAHIKPTRT